MYLETRDIDEMVDIYTGAWTRGVKTTYYLHMKPRHTAEQSTVKVNKAEEISGGSKKGFGAAPVLRHPQQNPLRLAHPDEASASVDHRRRAVNHESARHPT
jgi:ribonucleoside-diphosphate reductase alpha chain